MKQTTCSALAGEPTCEMVFTGSTADEIIDKGWKHMEVAHPELVEKIKAQPKEETDKWMANFKENVFPSLAEAEAEGEKTEEEAA